MNEEERKTTSSLNRRLGHVETGLAGLGTKVDSIDGALARVITALDVLTTKVGEGRQTNWAVVISSISLVIIIGGLCLAPIYARLADDKISQRRQWEEIRRLLVMEEKLSSLREVMNLKDELVEAYSQGRHERAVAQIEALEAKVMRIDEKGSQSVNTVRLGRLTE